MIDPFKITDFDRSESDLQEFLLFCVAVAGKKATMIASKISSFLTEADENELPFNYVRRLVASNLLVERLQDVKMGKYALLNKAWSDLTGDKGPDIKTCSADELQCIHGVGFKTARFFILHSRRDADVAVIDTHVLKYLASLGHQVPTSIPVGQQYLDLEAIMLELANAAGMTMADFDLAVWSHYASQGQHPLPIIQKQAA